MIETGLILFYYGVGVLLTLALVLYSDRNRKVEYDASTFLVFLWPALLVVCALMMVLVICFDYIQDLIVDYPKKRYIKKQKKCGIKSGDIVFVKNNKVGLLNRLGWNGIWDDVNKKYVGGCYRVCDVNDRRGFYLLFNDKKPKNLFNLVWFPYSVLEKQQIVEINGKHFLKHKIEELLNRNYGVMEALRSVEA